MSHHVRHIARDVIHERHTPDMMLDTISDVRCGITTCHTLYQTIAISPDIRHPDIHQRKPSVQAKSGVIGKRHTRHHHQGHVTHVKTSSGMCQSSSDSGGLGRTRKYVTNTSTDTYTCGTPFGITRQQILPSQRKRHNTRKKQALNSQFLANELVILVHSPLTSIKIYSP